MYWRTIFLFKKICNFVENVLHITFYITLDAPAPPTDLTVQECGSRRVSITWVPPVLDGNSPIVRYLVRYNPTQGICFLIKVATFVWQSITIRFLNDIDVKLNHNVIKSLSMTSEQPCTVVDLSLFKSVKKEKVK
jgi:hypothetical protein